MKKIPIPSMINWMWNLGFILSMSMLIQTITGMIIAMNFMNENNSFNNNMKIFFNNNWGWMMRIIHMNMPSMIFILIFSHMSRSIYFNSFKNMMMWNTGFLMLILTMISSFMGYTLPWSQMSYWGMMVITNTIAVIPIVGKNLMLSIWGNFNINETTLNRMFIIHFITPLMILIMSIIHINILHKKLSSNQLGLQNKIDMISLSKYFIIKDILMLMISMMMFINMIMMKPMMFNNPDNFIMMSKTITPNNIEPEWYFMLFYSMLRLINNKLGGLILSLTMMIMIFMIPFMMKKKFQSNKFYPLNKIIMWMLMSLMILISIMGFKKMEYPYLKMNMMFIKILFLLFPTLMLMNKISDKLS